MFYAFVPRIAHARVTKSIVPSECVDRISRNVSFHYDCLSWGNTLLNIFKLLYANP